MNTSKEERVVRALVRPDTYFDSVSLMAISRRLISLAGVRAAQVAMGTDMNREALARTGLATAATAAATPADLIIAVAADTAPAAQLALNTAAEMLEQGLVPAGATDVAGQGGMAGLGGPGGAPPLAAPAHAPRTLAAALRANPAANLAVISVPGAYAVREARAALNGGRNVFLFSDNVPLAEEVALKNLARARGLLLMGPDCGTAVLGGVGLGFANALRPGPVGIVAASGTGAQELSTLVHRLGSGVSHLIGTGGRDLTAAVGGMTTRAALRRLQDDAQTGVIVLISKPPDPAVAERVLAAARTGPKPVVVCLLGVPGGITIDAAAVQAVVLATGKAEAELTAQLADPAPTPAHPRPPCRYLRGLFDGGTLCDQALLTLEPVLGPVASNVHPDHTRRIAAGHHPGHLLLDLGDDAFTVGRPHPIIDPSLRLEHLRAAASDPTTAVILLDVILGFGAHPDPAGELAGAIRAAVNQGVAVVASVTGTDADPQGYGAQVAALRAAGAQVLPTALQAAQHVAAMMGEA